MSSLRLLAPLFVACLISTTGRAATAEENSPKANIKISQSQIDPDAVETLLGKVGDVRASGTSGEIGMDEILSFLPLTDSERAHVVEAHSAPVPISCTGDVCTGVSVGTEVYQNLSQINNIPAYFGPRVTINLRWRGPGILELCNIKGFQVKQVFWVNVDGAYIEARGADGSSFVDVSVGGSYPNC